MEIKELKTLLGFKDLRAIRSWCKDNNISIIRLGRKEYTSKKFLEDFIENQFNLATEESESPLNPEFEFISSSFSKENDKSTGTTCRSGNKGHNFTNENDISNLISKYK